jgi:hypothetical protein
MRPRAEMHEAWQAPSQTNWTGKRLADPAGTDSPEWTSSIPTTTTSSPPVGLTHCGRCCSTALGKRPEG